MIKMTNLEKHSNFVNTKAYLLPGEMHVVWQVVVQVRECNFVLCPYWLSDDDFVDVIELIPVLIPV